MRRSTLWVSLFLFNLGLLARAIAEEGAPLPVTIRDRMWTWCVDASYDCWGRNKSMFTDWQKPIPTSQDYYSTTS